MLTSFSWPKLIVSGSSAEQPNPASPNATMPSPPAPLGSTEISANAPARMNGSTWYASRLGNQRWTAANSTRPSVTMAQNTVSASEAMIADTRSEVRSSCDQFPFIVSQNPYSTANPANSQNWPGIGARRRPARRLAPAAASASTRSGSRALTPNSTTTAAAASTGSATQAPRPTNAATNAGASAVPRPSSELSTSTDRSTAAGWNAAANVFSDGTVSPKPAPRHAVAASSRPYATGRSACTNRLTISSSMAARLAASPVR